MPAIGMGRSERSIKMPLGTGGKSSSPVAAARAAAVRGTGASPADDEAGAGTGGGTETADAALLSPTAPGTETADAALLSGSALTPVPAALGTGPDCLGGGKKLCGTAAREPSPRPRCRRASSCCRRAAASRAARSAIARGKETGRRCTLRGHAAASRISPAGSEQSYMTCEPSTGEVGGFCGE